MRKSRGFFFKSVGTGDTQSIWVTTYNDMMTALMMFFLILWAYTQMVHAKKRAAAALPTSQPAVSTLRSEIRQELEAVGTVSMSARKVTVTLASAVLFAPGSAALQPQAEGALRRVGAALARSTAPVVVEGYTDDVPIRQSGWRSNYELSAARAFSVIRFLTTQGIPPNRLAGRGYGPFRPAARNDSEENRAKNRRIEIHLWMS